jgi:AcrR family transcriptional regulator
MHGHHAELPKRSAYASPQRPTSNQRAARTRRALGAALTELMLERHFDSITVQDVLDRAGVGRSTFYAHFRNKRDLFLSDYERFLESLEGLLERDEPHRRRLFPVTEFLRHLADMRRYLRALRESGQMELVWELGTAHFARMIERRLRLRAAPLAGAVLSLPLAGRFCAGALIETFKWWLDRDDRPTPEQMDALYHELVWRALGGSR